MSELKEPTPPQCDDLPGQIPAILQTVFDKMEREEELTVDEQNLILTLNVAQLETDLAKTKRALDAMVKSLCALVSLVHKGNVIIKKQAVDEFFERFDARAMIGTENVTGNLAITVQVKQKEGKIALVAASDADLKLVQRTRN